MSKRCGKFHIMMLLFSVVISRGIIGRAFVLSHNQSSFCPYPELMCSRTFGTRQNSSVLLTRNRSANLEHSFGLVDVDGKGYVTANDLQRLAQEVEFGGGNGCGNQNIDDLATSLSPEEAQAMIQLTSTHSSSLSASSSSDVRVSSYDFRRVLAPPSP